MPFLRNVPTAMSEMRWLHRDGFPATMIYKCIVHDKKLFDFVKTGAIIMSFDHDNNSWQQRHWHIKLKLVTHIVILTYNNPLAKVLNVKYGFLIDFGFTF